MTNEVDQYRGNKALATIQAALDTEKFLVRVTQTAVKGLDPKQIAAVALNVIRVNPALQKCTPHSIMGALCQAASVGLLPGNGLGQAYLIPRGGECQYQIGFQGWRELAMRSGHVSAITSRCVYVGDDFSFKWGIAPTIEHSPGAGHGIDDSQITHAYAVAIMKDGVPVVEVMTRAEIDRIRSMSQTARSASSPWNKHFGEMARKTVIIRLCKSLPRTPEIGRAIEHEEQDYIETTAEPLPKAPPFEGGEQGTPEARPIEPAVPQTPPPPPASTPPADDPITVEAEVIDEERPPLTEPDDSLFDLGGLG